MENCLKVQYKGPGLVFKKWIIYLFNGVKFDY